MLRILHASIRETIGEYLGAYPDIREDSNNFVFFNSKANNYSLSIKRGQAWKSITSICRDVGLSGNFGTHSLRKTWGYHARLSGVDLVLIMHKLNHESIAYTKRYLGITDDELEAVINRLNL
jgi:site-specific recombinase XerD